MIKCPDPRPAMTQNPKTCLQASPMQVHPVVAGHGQPHNKARWKPNMRNVPCLSFTAMALTVVMIGSAAAGSTLLPASERSYHDYYEAAVRGDPDAQASLAALYARDAGRPHADAYAFQWFMRAAGQGHAQAQLMLSEIFAAGKGVPKEQPRSLQVGFCGRSKRSRAADHRKRRGDAQTACPTNVPSSNRRSPVTRSWLEAEAGRASGE